MGLFLLISLGVIFLIGFLFGLIEILIPKKFFHFACKYRFLRFFYKRIYKIDSTFNIKYHRFIGCFSILFVSVLCLDIGYNVWEKTIPEERNLSIIISDIPSAELEYHGKLLFFDLYETNTVPLEESQLNEIKTLTKDLDIGYYKMFTSYPRKRYLGGLNNKYEYEPPKYVSIIFKNTNGEEIGSIKMFSEDQAYYVNEDNQCAPLKGDFKELYSYLNGLKVESD
ncbi:hypothetical protein KHQ81_08880 [Mycoplasmatota bacterium]|nr:hypothetical protein KHQ81_08880 [Mycoplasmatota bacterium]